MSDVSPTAPSFAHQVLAIDAIEVASRIAVQGSRAAIGASTVEIVAMAHRLLQLATLADLTFELLTTADLTIAETRPETRKSLTQAVRLKVSDVGAQLEALGYGQSQQEEKTNAKQD